jgi:hypothetical protein
MNRILLFTSILLMSLASACKPSQSGETSSNTPQQGPKHKVTGQVLHTRAYCGGAAPSEEMMERYRTPLPLPGLTLYLRSGRTNITTRAILDSTTTDAEGRFTFNLPAGEYCIITKARIKPPSPADYDRSMYEIVDDCVEELIVVCDATFSVADQDVEGLGLQLHKECFKEDFNPCVRYIGPMPP